MDNGLYGSVYNPDVLSCIANLSNDEVFISLEQIKEQDFDFSRGRDIILVLLAADDYREIREWLLASDLVEDVDFIYVPPRIGMEKSATSEYGMFANS